MNQIWITGFLGAGKSTLAHALREQGVQTHETSGLETPPDGVYCIAVADAANLPQCLGDPLFAPLLREQIGMAGLIAVSRGDVIDPAPTIEAVRQITSKTIVEAPGGALDPGLLAGIELSSGTQMDLTPRFAHWSYEGPSTLRLETAERLLEKRPDGLYRLSGTIRVEKGTLEVEIAGQVRQTRKLRAEGPTCLSGYGPRDRFRPAEMALSFAEAVSDSAARRGLFGYR